VAPEDFWTAERIGPGMVLLPASLGATARRPCPLENPLCRSDIWQAPKPMLQGLKFPLVFAQKSLAQPVHPLVPPHPPFCVCWDVPGPAGLCGGKGSQQQAGRWEGLRDPEASTLVTAPQLLWPCVSDCAALWGLSFSSPQYEGVGQSPLGSSPSVSPCHLDPRRS
jgi:hypothetical protein